MQGLKLDNAILISSFLQKLKIWTDFTFPSMMHHATFHHQQIGTIFQYGN